MRVEFTMTQEDLDKLIAAAKPVPYMIIGGVEPRSPQENANDAWIELGNRLGFEGMTAQPIPGKSPLCFTAIAKDIKNG